MSAYWIASKDVPSVRGQDLTFEVIMTTVARHPLLDPCLTIDDSNGMVGLSAPWRGLAVHT